MGIIVSQTRRVAGSKRSVDKQVLCDVNTLWTGLMDGLPNLLFFFTNATIRFLIRFFPFPFTKNERPTATRVARSLTVYRIVGI